MADTTVALENIVQQWSKDYFNEYVQKSRYFPYTGVGAENVITYWEDLTMLRGNTINIPLIGRLTGPGVTDDTNIVGNEEPLFNANHGVEIHAIRNGVNVTKWQQQLSNINFAEAGRQQLQIWSMDKLRDEQTIAFMSPSLNNTPYFSATEAEKDTWESNNADRISFGAAGAVATGDHSADLSTFIDAVNDKFTPENLDIARFVFEQADPHLNPVRINGNEDWLVAFCGSIPFRDFRNSATMSQANRDAWLRGPDNPLFSGGNQVWNSTIIVHVPQIPVIPGVGVGGIDVAPVFLCGMQALATAWAQYPELKTDVTDAQFRNSIVVEEMRGTHKLFYKAPSGSTVQHGMVTMYVAAVA